MGYSGNMYAQATEVITSQGDLRRGDSSGNPERLAIGSSGKVLQSNGTTESWETLSLADTVLTTQGDILYQGASALARLGQSTTNFTLATKGSSANPAWQASPTSVMSGAQDILYSSAANTLARLGAGTDGNLLTTHGTGSAPTWETPSSGGAWTANGTASSASAVSELAVSISNTPDVVQLLFNVSDDQEPAGTNSSFSFTINDNASGANDYDQKIFGFYNSFDYDEFLSQTKALCDRVTNSASRAGCVWIFRGDSNLKGNTGIQWRCSMLTGSSATPPEYVALSAGGNADITGDITSIEVMQSATDIIGKIQVNSMVYQ